MPAPMVGLISMSICLFCRKMRFITPSMGLPWRFAMHAVYHFFSVPSERLFSSVLTLFILKIKVSLSRIYLFFWHEAGSSTGWRKISKIGHLSPKEAAAQVILNVSGLSVGPEAAMSAARDAYEGSAV